jgi:hypothetical protein
MNYNKLFNKVFVGAEGPPFTLRRGVKLPRRRRGLGHNKEYYTASLYCFSILLLYRLYLMRPRWEQYENLYKHSTTLGTIGTIHTIFKLFIFIIVLIVGIGYMYNCEMSNIM